MERFKKSNREFIIIINKSEVFLVHNESKDGALQMLYDYAYKHSDGEKYKEYWTMVMDAISNDNFIISENYDYCGIKKLTN